MEHRPRVVQQHPDLKATEIMSELGKPLFSFPHRTSISCYKKLKHVLQTIQTNTTNSSTLCLFSGRIWNNMSESDKSKYTERYKIEKEQYNLAMTRYIPDPEYTIQLKKQKTSHPYSSSSLTTTTINSTAAMNNHQQIGKKGKQRRDPNAPKRPTSNYLLFQSRKYLV